MNEKKAIVFFFVVVFFCFSFLLPLVVVVTSTYVTYVFLSPSLPLSCRVLFVSVCSSSPPWRTLTCVCFARLVCAAVCLSISTFCCRCCCFRFFFSGASLCFKRCPSCALGFFFNFCNSRGSLSPLFIFAAASAAACIEQNTHVQTRTQHTHRRTDGRTGSGGGKSARAPLVLGSTHKTILRFFIVVCYCYYYDWLLLLLLLFTFASSSSCLRY